MTQRERPQKEDVTVAGSKTPDKEIEEAKIEESVSGEPESPQSPQEILSEKIFEVLTSEKPGEVLVEKVLEKKEIPPYAYRPVHNAILRIEGFFDFQERLAELRKMKEEGALPPDIYKAMVGALLKDERSTIQFLESFAKTQMSQLHAKYGEKIPREAFYEIRAKLTEGFVGEAERLYEAYVVQGKTEVPEAELAKIREGMEALPKSLRNAIRSEVGSLALADAETSFLADEGGVSLQKVLSIMEIMYGEEDAGRLRGAHDLYRVIYQEYKYAGKPILTARPRGMPLFTLNNMFEIAKHSRLWLGVHEDELDKDTRGSMLSDLRALEDFILLVADRDKKDGIRSLRDEMEDRERMVRAGKQVLDLQKELSGQFSNEYILKGMREQVKEVEKALRGTIKELAATSPLAAEELLERALHLNAVRALLTEEIAVLESDGTARRKEATFPAGEEKRYTAEAFEAEIERLEGELPGDIAAATDWKEKRRFQDRQEVIAQLKKSKAKLPLRERLQTAFIEGLLSKEKFLAFRTFFEASATASEIEAKRYEAYATELNRVDRGKLTQTLQERLDKNIKDALREIADLYDLVKYYRG